MAGVLYSIRDWDKHFEIAQSRKADRLTWVAMPNKHDGKSYRRIMRREDGPAIFAAWVLIVEVASKCPIRGVLADDDGPLTAEDLECKTDCPAKVFEDALAYLSSPEIGWIAGVPTSELPDDSHCNLSKCPTGQDRTEQDRTEQEAVCAETGEPSSAPLADCEPFPCDGNKREWTLTQAKLDQWQTVYPSLDCLQECRKARQWLLDNPARRKTHNGMFRFLGNWLARAQNGARASPQAKSKRPRPLNSRRSR